MKRLIPFFSIAIILASCSTPSIDVNSTYVKSVDEADNFDKTGSNFLPNVKEFLVVTVVNDIKEKTDFTTELLYISSDDKTTVVASDTKTAQPSELYDLVFGFQQPSGGWPIGDYIVNIRCTSIDIPSLSMNMSIAELSENKKAEIGKLSAPKLTEISMCNAYEGDGCFSSDSVFSSSNGEIFMSNEIHQANEKSSVALKVLYLAEKDSSLVYTAALDFGEAVIEHNATDFGIHFGLPLNGDWKVGKYQLEVSVVNSYADKRYFTFYLQ